MRSPYRNFWEERRRWRLSLVERMRELLTKSIASGLTPEEAVEKERIKMLLKALD